MAFFDEIGKRMNGVAQSAQKTAEIARLQRQINSEENEFSELFSEIGKLYYSCRQRETTPGEAMDHLCDRVDALAQNIEQMKKKLDDLKQIRRCPSCGSVQSSNSRFCANCGAKLEERPAAQEAPAVKAEEKPESTQKSEETESEGKSVYINWPGQAAAPDAPGKEEAPEQPENHSENDSENDSEGDAQE